MSGPPFQPPLTFDEWRERARPYLLARVLPDIACRAIGEEAATPSASTAAPLMSPAPLMLPAPLMRLLESISCYRAAGRYELMYRLAWRTLAENPSLLEDAADADVRNAMRMDSAVRRDVHKMHAFVRFREVPDKDGEAAYFAWFEPDHDILRRGSAFFVKRFPNMHWTIATPRGAAVWNGIAVTFLDSPHFEARPASDSHESLWRTYYRSICNLARVNVPAMQREMPKKYWKNLPEAADIGKLIGAALAPDAARDPKAPQRTEALAQAAARALPDLPKLDEGPQQCRRCDLWRRATQAVLGQGRKDARIVLVGEQPGDSEDLQGHPFVGPAGRILGQAIAEAGLVRSELYLTNAVKHFKWEPRGKRRLHKRPDLAEVSACGVWLEREIAGIRPRVIVALGATALRSLTGSTSPIEAARRQTLSHPSGAKIVATYHPAAILRADGGRADDLRARLVEDLAHAAHTATMSAPPSTGAPAAARAPSAPAFLQGGGEMGALMRSHDWVSNPLGPPTGWPAPLQTAIGVVLNTGHPMYVWWGTELLCFYNDAFRQSIGPERHPGSLGRPGREVWDEVWDIIGPQIHQVMSGSGATWHENALVPITRNGRREEVYWTYSYSPIVDPASPTGVGGVLVVCAETTAHIVAARHAAQDRERFAQLFEQAPSFVAILRGPEHRFELTNPSYQRLIGHRNVIGFTVAEALPEAAGQGYIELLDRVYSSGEPYTATGAKYGMQLTPLHPVDERYLDFVYQPIKDPDGRVNGIFVEGVDVTSRTLSDASRRVSEEQLRLATDAAEIGLWDVDVGSDTLYWPPRVKAMFGISADRPVSMRDDFFPCLHPDDRDRVTEALNAALDPKRRALYDVEYRTIGKEDGVLRWVAAKGRAVFDGDRCLRVLGTAIDITTRKAADAELQMLNERLEQRVSEILAEKQAAEAQMRQAQKLEALGQLTGGVAHDFNNLLMIIKGGLSLLKRPLIEPERRQKLLSSMEQAADRGANLSRQLLAFARRQPLRMESVDLRRHIESMRELLDRSLRGDVQVRTEFEDGLWPVEVDPAQLELVILNLCVNARDAMPNGGVISIAAENHSQSLHPETSGEFVALSVTDPGTGMPPEVLEHVFEPFFTTKEIGKGSGLGLPQVHGFAEQSGGSVKIESRAGEGTKVTLLLPRTQTRPIPTPVAPSGEASSRQAGSMGSILLVEDDNEVAALVTEMLRELGYCITRAASAQAALGALANDRPIDVVFSDVMMPGEKNGLDLAAEIARRRPNLKVLLTTGYAAGLTSSVNKDVHVLRKPYDIRSLDVALRRVLGDKSG